MDSREIALKATSKGDVWNVNLDFDAVADVMEVGDWWRNSFHSQSPWHVDHRPTQSYILHPQANTFQPMRMRLSVGIGMCMNVLLDENTFTLRRLPCALIFMWEFDVWI